MEGIPLIPPKNIIDICKYYILHPSITFLQNTLLLTDSYCVPSKTAVKETSAFKASAFQHPFDMVAIESLRNLENKT